jgi:cytochrome b subunit of formate dehydrogenase
MAKKTPAPAPARAYARFALADRAQHLLMLISFTTLAITGLVQKFALSGVSVFIVRLWGGIENVRATHHVAATVLMLIAIYHLVAAGYRSYVLRKRLTILPSLQDIKDAWAAFTFNLSLGRARPQMGRYTFEEKAEYWALVWGILIMGLTGFIMWNPLATVRLLPGEFIPASKAAHGAEAILAVLAIIVWHMYGMHLKRFNKSMWTGQITESEMLHEHPLELADVKAGIGEVHVSPTTLRRRQMIYYPVAGLFSLVMLFGVYGFVNGEQTAITTVPLSAATIPVYVPQTPTPLPPTPTQPPTPTRAPTEASSAASTTPGVAAPVTWAEVSMIFAARCGMCHSATLATQGLSLGSYADALKGAQDGPVILPGDPENSKLVVVQTQGGHPGQLTPEELALIRAWIQAGALEK